MASSSDHSLELPVYRITRGESPHPTFRKSSCCFPARLPPSPNSGVTPPSNPPLRPLDPRGDPDKGPPFVRSKSLRAAGVRTSTRLGVSAVSFSRPDDDVPLAPGLGVSSPAFFDNDRPASLPNLLPSESRAFGGLITNGDGTASAGSLVSSEPPREMTRGVASSVPSVMSSLTPRGPSCDGDGDGIASTNPKPAIFGESDRDTSITPPASGDKGTVHHGRQLGCGLFSGL